MKRKEELLYNEMARYSTTHKNPSVWALQNVFDLSYERAIKLRVRLINDGYIDMFEKKQTLDGNFCIISLNKNGYIKISALDKTAL